jgi:AraC-like DNA-binding protein
MPRADPRNIARYWRDRRMRGLSLMQADFTTQAFAPHRHQAFVIAVTEAGGSVINSRGITDEARPSRLLVFNPDEPHSGWMGSSQRWRYRSLYLEQTVIEDVARGIGTDRVPYFLRNVFTDGDLIAGFEALHRALLDGQDALRERELLIATLGELFQRHGSGGRRVEPAPRDHRRLGTAVELMQARLTDTLSLAELGTALGLTEYQLISLFKRNTGLTPHAYVTQLRLDAACRHLATGLPIADAAIVSGFYDQSALTRHFKRTYGVTPRQFAETAR